MCANAFNKLRKARKNNKKRLDNIKDEIESNSLSLIRSESEKITLNSSSSIKDSRRKAAEQTKKDFKEGLIPSLDEDAILKTHRQMKNGTYDRQKLKLEKAKKDRQRNLGSDVDTDDVNALLDFLEDD